MILGLYSIENLLDTALERFETKDLTIEVNPPWALATDDQTITTSTIRDSQWSLFRTTPDAISQSHAFEFQGEFWAIHASAGPKYIATHGGEANWILWVIGVSFSLLVATLVGMYDRMERFNIEMGHQQELALINEALRAEVDVRRKTEVALKKSEEAFRSMSERIHMGIWRSDEDGRVSYVNPFIEQLWGFPKESFYADWGRLIHEKDRDQLLAVFTEAVAKQKSFRHEFTVVRPDGKELIILGAAEPFISPDGVYHGHIGTFQDRTTLRSAEAERETIRTQLVQAQKLEAVGRLAAGIAHEINTPIQYIANNTSFLQSAAEALIEMVEKQDALVKQVTATGNVDAFVEEWQEEEESADLEFLRRRIPKAIEDSQEGVERVSAVITAMRDFAHPGSGEMQPMNINHALRSTATVTRNEYKYIAEVVFELDDTLPEVEGLPDELNQVYLNLIINAAHAIEERKKEDPSHKGLIILRTRFDDHHAYIDISDNGCGIPEDHMEKVFEPFFTTKEVGKGTGQGLAIANAVVTNKHNGSIEVGSVPGEGTTFTIALSRHVTGGRDGE